MGRKFNFCAGPAAIPEEVLLKAQGDMLDWQGRGLSVMEMSHRSAEYVAIAEQAEADLRELLTISDDYAVLFMQGGATTQFSAVPMNLLAGAESADYMNTGQWSKKAIKEASRYTKVNVVASSEQSNFSSIPAAENWQLNDNAAYFHYTPNETIGGVEFHFVPEVNTPIVADMSSTILSRPIDVSKFGLIYAGAQKNIGPAGLAIVIVRKELLGRAQKSIPSLLDYQVISDGESMVNTPPTYTWYLAGLVFDWLKRGGGLEAQAERNKRKAGALYAAIDESGFYSNPVDLDCRSFMNVPFTLANAELDKLFLSLAEERGLLNLKGHRSVGGMRASIYNAVSEEAVAALINFMQDFERDHA
ncbi:MAG: 3-phosphoserine/phosphohydroxythreonine transaminase [Pseudomonadales bacterium]